MSPLSPLVISLFSMWVCFCSVCKRIYVISWIPQINDIIWYLSFSAWLTSLVWSYLGPSTANGNIFHGWVIFHCAYTHLLIPISGHLGCFHVLAVINSAAMNVNLLFKMCSQWHVDWCLFDQISEYRGLSKWTHKIGHQREPDNKHNQ